MTNKARPAAGITRRRALRGLGVSLGLPWLESLWPRAARAGEPPAAPPRRMAFLFVPNGMNMADWTPKDEGPLGALPPILQPLEEFKSELLVLSGLALDGGRPHGDGPGDHAREVASFLTGAHPFKTNGKDIRNGISADQAAAAQIGLQTRLPSLELGCDPSAQAGNCDSGYSCIYTSNMSWRTPTAPMLKETNPRAVFDRLFGRAAAADPQRAAKEAVYRRSLVDLVRDDAQQLQRQLAAADQQKLDEYLYAVRQIERRIEEAERFGRGEARLPDYPRPAGQPRNFVEHVRLMMDLMVLAFQADATRIVTFMYANGGSNRSYPDIGVSSGHHELSHHSGDAKKLADISQINRHHAGLLAYLLGKLKAVGEGSATLLDQCMVMYGASLGDGNRHNHDDLPIVVAGRGGGLRPGRHLRFPFDTPLTNLYLAMLRRMGCRAERFGDSTGELTGLG